MAEGGEPYHLIIWFVQSKINWFKKRMIQF